MGTTWTEAQTAFSHTRHEDPALSSCVSAPVAMSLSSPAQRPTPEQQHFPAQNPLCRDPTSFPKQSPCSEPGPNPLTSIPGL